jgi:hypothetical protein
MFPLAPTLMATVASHFKLQRVVFTVQSHEDAVCTFPGPDVAVADLVDGGYYFVYGIPQVAPPPVTTGFFINPNQYYIPWDCS